MPLYRAILTTWTQSSQQIRATAGESSLARTYPSNDEHHHRLIAEQLRDQLGWKGELEGGRVRVGVWAFVAKKETFLEGEDGDG